MTAVVALLGLGFGLGMWLILTGWSAGERFPAATHRDWHVRLGPDVGRRVGSAAAGYEATLFDYDNVGQLTKVTSPDGSYVQYSYDSAQRLWKINDGLGNRTSATQGGGGVTASASQTWTPATSRTIAIVPVTARPTRHVSPITSPRRLRNAAMRCRVLSMPARLSEVKLPVRATV